MGKRNAKYLLLVLVAALVSVFFISDASSYLSFEALKAQKAELQQYFEHNQVVALAAYFLLYVAVTALSLPGAAIMTLAGGAVFGLGLGILVVSFASTIGATLAFLVSRFLLRDSIQERFQDKLAPINRGVEEDGAFYLFTLRLVPAFPFFVVNLLMGLSPIKTSTYYIVSQLAMLPGTIVYVNGGTQLAKLESPHDLLSPSLIASFILLGVFPIIAKKVIFFLKKQRAK